MAEGHPTDSVSSPPAGFLQYDRTVIAFHGTDRATANRLVEGAPFEHSDTEDEWLGTGIYFWEQAPKQAWNWTKIRGHNPPAVVGVPADKQKRVWKGSWIYAETHIQICVRTPSNILAVWHVRQDGRYGLDSTSA